MIARPLAALGLGALLASCAAPGPPRTPREMIDRALAGAPGAAQPSEVVAAELAFARMAQEKGQWTAFREFAAEGAMMFVPQPVNAKDWLGKQADPPRAVAWQPHEVWMSCDGSMAVTRGAWQRPDGSNGYFTTVWQRSGRPGRGREGRDERYRWVLDQGDVLVTPLAAPDFIRTKLADCTPQPSDTGTHFDMSAASARGEGWSHDRTLRYKWSVAPDLSRRLSVSLMLDGKAEEVLVSAVAAPQARGGAAQ